MSLSRSPPGDADDRGKKDATWPRGVPPRKKKEKDVFRFLKDHDANYTVRRQEFQMSRIIEKCRTVKEVRQSPERLLRARSSNTLLSSPLLSSPLLSSPLLSSPLLFPSKLRTSWVWSWQTTLGSGSQTGWCRASWSTSCTRS